MYRKTIAVCFLLALAILIGIPESFAHPENGGSCSTCHVMNADKSGVEKEISTRDIDANAGLTQGNAQTGDIPRQMRNPLRYYLGVIGTFLVVISQFYSLRKRVLRKRGR
jgi:hypothetical protein